MGRKSKKEGILIIFKSKNCEKNLNKCKVMIKHLCDKIVVQSPSHVGMIGISWTAANQHSLCLTIAQRLPTFMSIISVMPSSHLILCHPLPFLPSIFPSIRVFFNESGNQSIGTSASASVLSTNSGLISFRVDWFDLLAVQGTLNSLPLHHVLKVCDKILCNKWWDL